MPGSRRWARSATRMCVDVPISVIVPPKIDAKLIGSRRRLGEVPSRPAAVTRIGSRSTTTDVLFSTDENTVAAVLMALGNRLAATVLEEFRTPAEIEMARRYLDTIRGATGVDNTPTAAATGRP